MQSSTTPVIKDLVLVGGGHAHVAVLRRFGMKPVPGLRLTLITRDVHTPYSGMLPGYLAGHYDYDACHVDLGPLARFAGARLYHAEVAGLDAANRILEVVGRPPVTFDLLSINIGSRPRTLDVPGAAEFAIPVKPIDAFLVRWEVLIARVLTSRGPFRIGVVGGGAGGVEVVLATRHRLRQCLRERGDDPARLSFSLLTAGPVILPTHNPGVQARFQRVLRARGIAVLTGHRVREVTATALLAEGQAAVAVDATLWVTSAAAPVWPGAAGLAVTDEGFIRVDTHLQSVSHPGVFAAGDVAALSDPRPKSGVFAVRQGPVLAENLRRAATGRRLVGYRPQRRFLGLISTGDRYAVASRGGWSLEGAWLWRAKDWIDRRFMTRFNDLPRMPADQTAPALAAGIADQAAIRELSTLAMRCGGCGAKVGSSVLTRVMQRLSAGTRADVLVGLDAPDDAAVLLVPPGKLLVQSVDYFRAFLDDAYLFGQIAANHALGDLFAMGAEPQSVLAIATVPYGLERVVEETLHDLMRGALASVGPTGAVLAGGHSSEGAELAFGLTVNGLVDPDTAGILSSLQPQNLRLRRAVRDLEQTARHPLFPLLFDPQTAGGLLAGVPAHQATACVAELQARGYPAARIIGRIEAAGAAAEPITVKR